MDMNEKALAALKDEHTELIKLIAESEGQPDMWGWHRQTNPECKTCSTILALESQPPSGQVSVESLMRDIKVALYKDGQQSGDAWDRQMMGVLRDIRPVIEESLRQPVKTVGGVVDAIEMALKLLDDRPFLSRTYLRTALESLRTQPQAPVVEVPSELELAECIRSVQKLISRGGPYPFPRGSGDTASFMAKLIRPRLQSKATK